MPALILYRNLRKIEILFKAFEKAKKNIDYFALDVNLAELHRTFGQILIGHYQHVKFHGLHGTYDDGLNWLARPENTSKPTCVLTMGSSIGNFDPTEAAAFLSAFAKVLKPRDLLLVGLDACQSADRVYRAYNDSAGVTEQFYRNGLEHANLLLGTRAFRQHDWRVEGLYNSELHRHEAYFVPIQDVDIGGVLIRKGERIHLENAFKYSLEQSHRLWNDAGLIEQIVYANHDGSYST